MESLVALSILLISITGTLGLFTIGFRTLVVPKHLTVATNIARANMEEIRSAPFEQIKEYDNTPTDSPTLYTSCPLTSLPDGQLEIDVDDSNPDLPDLYTISVTVSWQEDYRPNHDEIELLTSVASP